MKVSRGIIPLVGVWGLVPKVFLIEVFSLKKPYEILYAAPKSFIGLIVSCLKKD